MPLRRIVSIRHEVCCALIIRNPLDSTCGTLRLHPLKGEQIVQILRGPGSWIGGPCAFQTTGDCVLGVALATLVVPAKTLFAKKPVLDLFLEIGLGFPRPKAPYRNLGNVLCAYFTLD